MPGVNYPNNERFAQTIADLHNRVRALETQQQATITNAVGQPLINFGLAPGSVPAMYGLQFLSPDTGTPIAFMGQDSNGVALRFYDASGNERIRIDQLGLHQYDSSGNQVLLLGAQSDGSDGLGVFSGSAREVMLGLINASPAIYGLAVRPYGGSTLQQVGGWLGSGALSESGVSTSSRYVTFSGASTITAEVGPSGDVMINGGFEIDTNASGVQGSVAILIDGGPNTIEIARLQVGSTSASSVGGTFQWGSLSAGTHTFTAQYLTSGTGTADFYGNFYIQPL